MAAMVFNKVSIYLSIYHIGFWADFHFLQDQANFWQTDLFSHEIHRSVIVLVDLRFIIQK